MAYTDALCDAICSIDPEGTGTVLHGGSLFAPMEDSSRHKMDEYEATYVQNIMEEDTNAFFASQIQNEVLANADLEECFSLVSQRSQEIANLGKENESVIPPTVMEEPILMSKNTEARFQLQINASLIFPS